MTVVVVVADAATRRSAFRPWGHKRKKAHHPPVSRTDRNEILIWIRNVMAGIRLDGSEGGVRRGP
jgi:hypothetical protein